MDNLTNTFKDKLESQLDVKIAHIISSHPVLSEERLRVYTPFMSRRDGNRLMSLKAELMSTGEIKEFLFEYNSVDAEIVFPVVSCQITYEDIPLGDCPEYCFHDDPEWRIAQVSDAALSHFREKKFKLWEHQLKEPECEAAFRRLLQQGPIRNVYDKFIFSSSEAVAQKYKVKDEHSGKLVDIPHQVDRMRRCEPVSGTYSDIDCSLIGAPKTESDATLYWTQFLEELRQLRGKDYIDQLLGLV